MNRVRAIDPIDMTMEVEAGFTLKAAQEAAAAADCLLPLSISSEGSAQIGGVLATNAGGNNTVRYGKRPRPGARARSRVAGRAGVERAPRLHKDNTGYCCASCSSAAKGRSASSPRRWLKLYPQPREMAVALWRGRLARGGARAIQPLAAV